MLGRIETMFLLASTHCLLRKALNMHILLDFIIFVLRIDKL